MPVETYPYSIEYYVAEDGKNPFKVWLESLHDVRGRAKIRFGLTGPGLGTLGIKSMSARE